MKSRDFYNYLLNNYEKEKPIILANINIDGMSESAKKLQMKRLVEKKLVMKQMRGVYYLPKENKYDLPSICSIDEISKYKYLASGNKVYGYYGGETLLNKVGVTLQVPMKDTIYTNKETNIKRYVKIGNIVFILKRPYCFVTNENVKILQFLELLRAFYNDEEMLENFQNICDYIVTNDISIEGIEKYIECFPKKVNKRYKIIKEKIKCIYTKN